MSDSFALIPKTITGSWGSEWECCNGITTRQHWPFSQRKPGCDRFLPLGKGFLCCLLRAKGVSLCLRLLPKRAEHSRDGDLNDLLGEADPEVGFSNQERDINH